MESQANRIMQIRRQVRHEAHFYRHLMTYIVVISGLFLLNYLTLRETSSRHIWNWWVIWPAFGWGIGILSHAFGTFNHFGPFSKNWQERKVQALLDRESSDQSKSGNAQ